MLPYGTIVRDNEGYEYIAVCKKDYHLTLFQLSDDFTRYYDEKTNANNEKEHFVYRWVYKEENGSMDHEAIKLDIIGYNVKLADMVLKNSDWHED